jgi:hypothetical protein
MEGGEGGDHPSAKNFGAGSSFCHLYLLPPSTQLLISRWLTVVVDAAVVAAVVAVVAAVVGAVVIGNARLEPAAVSAVVDGIVGLETDVVSAVVTGIVRLEPAVVAAVVGAFLRIVCARKIDDPSLRMLYR